MHPICIFSSCLTNWLILKTEYFNIKSIFYYFLFRKLVILYLLIQNYRIYILKFKY